MDLMSIQHLSRVLSWILVLVLVLLCSMWLIFFINISYFQSIAMNNLKIAIQWDTVNSWQLYIACFMSMLSSLVLIWGIVNLRKAFEAFSTGKIFELSNVVFIKRFSATLILSSLINPMIHSLLSVVLSFNHPASQKIFAISINSINLSILFIGLVFWLISKILIQAYHLSVENKAFI